MINYRNLQISSRILKIGEIHKSKNTEDKKDGEAKQNVVRLNNQGTFGRL